MTTFASPLGIERRELEYVYQDGDGFVFLDSAADELVTVPYARAGAALPYLKEGDRVGVMFHDGQAIDVEPATAVRLRVTDTSSLGAAAPKLAVLETGLKIAVPACIDVGDIVIVDTRQAMYLGRES